MADLPVDRTTANTPAEHVADHNALHATHNLIDGDGSNGQVLTRVGGVPTWAAPSGSTETWQTWVPTLQGSTSNPTLGATSTQLGRYMQNGKTVSGWATIKNAGAGAAAGSGDLRIPLPVTPRTETDLKVCGSHLGFSSGLSNGPVLITAGAAYVVLYTNSGRTAASAAGSASEWYIDFTYEAA